LTRYGKRKQGSKQVENRVTIKEPFLLGFAIVLILGSLLPKTVYRKRNGKPYENLLGGRIAFLAIGLALLMLWYSMPPK